MPPQQPSESWPMWRIFKKQIAMRCCHEPAPGNHRFTEKSRCTYYTCNLRISVQMLPAELTLTAEVYNPDATNNYSPPAFKKELLSFYYDRGHVSSDWHMGTAILLHFQFGECKPGKNLCCTRQALWQNGYGSAAGMLHWQNECESAALLELVQQVQPNRRNVLV